MGQPKQKQTTELKNETKKTARKGKQQEKATPPSKAEGATRYKCHPKEADSDSINLKTIDPNTIDPRSPEADDQVMRSLLEMATSGKNTTAAIFWAKARCGMNEKGRGKERQVSQAPTIVIRTEEGKKA